MNSHLLIESAAKINLSLGVAGKRHDGYHLLETIMQSISLRDQLEISWNGNGNGIVLLSDHEEMPLDERNTCSRAARLWQQKTGLTGQLSISIDKKIPLQAGLGGGSADAAAIIYSLNLIHDEPLDQLEMNSIAAQTGADVPFCLHGGIGFCQGIGEIITELPPMPVRPVLLIKPDFGLSTPEVFRSLNWQYNSRKPDHTKIIDAVRQGSWKLLSETSFNVLQQPACKIRPEIGSYLELLRQTSAEMVMMTGSGACVYAVYYDSAALITAQDFIAPHLAESDQIKTAETCEKSLRILDLY